MRPAALTASQAEREVFQEALDAIAAERYARIVTNANVMMPDTWILLDVTDNLAHQGIGFITVSPTEEGAVILELRSGRLATTM